ncbi:hypothetical protein BJ138DRAFT_1119004 [Hygrophoropsis aurantiaca]|uniref:Uncharacterized protein n=1 Tax=Hygrophoropsis aurantiaca TaxID=72124 RepID=A0ACB7ZV82_9AGAM|nr:hypothetical protein BJ138DRAFT_1119004 [Hygrophoropsis aurantiaca]
MGRPRLYRTPEEAAAAARKYRKKYYDRNHGSICMERKAKYRAKKYIKPVFTTPSVSTRAPDIVSANVIDTQKHGKSWSISSKQIHVSLRQELIPVQSSWTVEQQLKALFGDSLDTYMRFLCSDVIATDDTVVQEKMVTEVISSADSIRSNAWAKENCVLNSKGVGAEYQKASHCTQCIQAAIGRLEDLLCAIMSGPDELALFCSTEQLNSLLGDSCAKFSVTMSKWASTEQDTWLKAYFTGYYKPCMVDKNYTAFWPKFYKDWSDKWPERSLCPQLKDKPLDEPLTTGETAILAAATIKRREQLTNKIRWLGGGRTRSRIVLSGKSTNSLGTLTTLSKGTRAPQAREVFAKLETDDGANYGDTIRLRLEERIEEEGLKGDRAAIMKARQQITKQVYDEVDDEVRALVAAKQAEMAQEVHEKKKAVKLAKTNRSPEDIQKSIDVMPNTMAKLLLDLHNLTGWSYTVLAGGPEPGNQGRLKSISLHVGDNEAGRDFGSALLGFKDKIVKPFDMFLRTVYTADVNEGSVSSSDKSDTNSTTVRLDVNMRASSEYNSDSSAESSFGSAGPMLRPSNSAPLPLHQQQGRHGDVFSDASSGALAFGSAGSLLGPSNGAPLPFHHQQTVAPSLLGASAFGIDMSQTRSMYRIPPGVSMELAVEFNQELNGTIPSISGHYEPTSPNVPFQFDELGDIVNNDWLSSTSSLSAPSSFVLPGMVDLDDNGPTLPVPTPVLSMPAVSPPRLTRLNASQIGNVSGSSNQAHNTELPPITTPPRFRHLTANGNTINAQPLNNVTSAPQTSSHDGTGVGVAENTLLTQAPNEAMSAPPLEPEKPNEPRKRTQAKSKRQEQTSNRALSENYEDPNAESEQQNGRSKRIRTMSKRREQDNAIGTAPAKKGGVAARKGSRVAG